MTMTEPQPAIDEFEDDIDEFEGYPLSGGTYLVSDTLSDAADEIEHYQERFPEWYGDLEAEIDAVKAAMRALTYKIEQKVDALRAAS